MAAVEYLPKCNRNIGDSAVISLRIPGSLSFWRSLAVLRYFKVIELSNAAVNVSILPL